MRKTKSTTPSPGNRRLVVLLSLVAGGCCSTAESLAISQPHSRRVKRRPSTSWLRASIPSTTSSSHDGDTTAGANAEILSIWPRMDELDKRMIKIALPCIANFAINPLIGAVDLFWVNRMGNALAVAGQAAANQVFSSAFWIVSVLPSVTATLVSKANARGDMDEVQDAVSQALF